MSARGIETWAFFEYPIQIIDMVIHLCDWWAVNLEILEGSLRFCQAQDCEKHNQGHMMQT